MLQFEACFANHESHEIFTRKLQKECKIKATNYVSDTPLHSIERLSNCQREWQKLTQVSENDKS